MLTCVYENDRIEHFCEKFFKYIFVFISLFLCILKEVRGRRKKYSLYHLNSTRTNTFLYSCLMLKQNIFKTRSPGASIMRLSTHRCFLDQA